ncbi:uncharacterized protein LOC143865525 [Tasmannia lanceolata]|uniref:uncharacterized protein LOC143865525 n=1 Tax=Tasmannia lanceolata TaxID=3420 RepID=UPI004063B7C8
MLVNSTYNSRAFSPTKNTMFWQSKDRILCTTSNSPSLSNTSKYTVYFSGESIETTVTNDPSSIDEWLYGISMVHRIKPIVVGLDCELRPDDYSIIPSKVAVLQLCIGGKCLVLQIFYMVSIPLSLKRFLLDPKFTFVGIGIGDDVSKLMLDYGLNVCSVIDIGELGMVKGYRVQSNELF